jgi:arylsulfatase A-like enzyme
MTARPMPQPNLIFIMTDQQRADTIGALGATHMITPHMDRLVREGTAFTHAFCPGATCVPSRAATFTGMHAHNLGCQSFYNWGHHRTWIQDLADAGYHCANVGKMHFQPRDVAGGFHDRVVVENPTSVDNWGGRGDDAWGRYLALHGHARPNHRHRTDPQWRDRFQSVPWHLEERFHSDVFTADTACAWIREHRGPEPVFLQIGFPGPHEPWDAPQRILDLYAQRALPELLPPDPSELDAKPPQHRAHQRFHATVDHESRIDMPGASTAEIDRMRRAYFAKITFVDEQLGKVLAALESKGWLDDSLLIFCSDHGEMLGEHGLAYKWLMYDSVVRVPLVIRQPRAFGAGRRVTELVSLLDLGPTLLEAAGVPVPSRLEGRSLGPLLAGAPGESRAHVFCEDNYLTMIRSRTRKLVLYLGQEEGEFYNLEIDPEEHHNHWADPSMMAEKQEMLITLLRWLATSVYFNSGYRCGEGAHYRRRWPALGNYALHGANHASTLPPEG